MISLAIDDLGSLWTWGNCPVPETSTAGGFSPIPIQKFEGCRVVKVACGSEHILALVDSRDKKSSNLICYSWGNNNHGQLGLGDTESRSNPQMVETFNECSPYELACGSHHTSVLAYRKTESGPLESTCWTFGCGSNGQLGHGTTKNSFYPETVNGLPENLRLVSVDCGLFHTSVVSSSGNVWSWGMENGLGLCPGATFTETDSGDALTPRSINGPFGSKFPEPVQVACGAAHTVLLADNGYQLWSWGRGKSGVLGTGQETDFFNPKSVLWPSPDEKGTKTEKGREEIEKGREETTEIEKKLTAATEEMNRLQSKLFIMERYASILHGSIFGKPFEEENDIPLSLRNSGIFDIAKEWEGMLESYDRNKLVRLQMFYRNMLAGVEDKMMKQMIKEMIKEHLESSSSSRS